MGKSDKHQAAGAVRRGTGVPFIEMFSGVVVLAAAGVLPTGLADRILPLSALGLGAALALALVGAMLLVHGTIRWRLARTTAATFDHRSLRAHGRLLWTLFQVTVMLAGVAWLAVPLDLVKVAGFPLGYYAAAQGVLLLLTILAFRAARRLDELGLEAEAGLHPGPEDV